MNEPSLSDAALAELLTLTISTINGTGIIVYKNHLGEYHRIHGPAVIYANGSKWWYKDGWQHRTDGPAVEWSNGHKEWYLDGVRCSEWHHRSQQLLRQSNTGTT